jgi:hypothetical protein
MAKSKGRGKHGGKSPSVMGYFRKIFREQPQLLGTRSNQEVIQQWLRDNPEHQAMPASVRNTLSNLKSMLRKKLRGPKPQAEGLDAGSGRRASSQLETLELHIDDALTLARTLDANGLESVIRLLRRARNEVVWKLGQ